jgi:hypothetical protein
VWQLAGGGGSLRGIRERLVEEYDAEPSVIERDLLALADTLVTKGLWTLK